MPGRLMMEASQPAELKNLKRDGSHISHTSDGPSQKRVASGLEGVASEANGIKTEHTPTALTHVNGLVPLRGEAPELEQFRETLVPYGKLLGRMAQQTYFDLTEVVERLADMRVSAPVPNGLVPQPATDKNVVSIDKKARLMDFAQTHKDRFIKALVLSDWARNMDDVACLIDVSMFLRKQDWATSAAADSIDRMRDNMTGAKMPNPNIEGALELLATGEAPWMPDLGYIAPEPLTHQEILAALHDMNFALLERLNLLDDLPAAFRDYSVADGRATFVVPGEFEVDLAIADDDADSPFYFIDVRLLFYPTPESLNDRLRTHVESHVNVLLAAQGLQGCYNFLHNLILTHKLGIIRQQMMALARGKFIDHLYVQQVHRSLVVQYWPDQSGAKHWIEIGISSAGGSQPTRTMAGDGAAKPTRITSRWFRRGTEVEHDLSFDWVRLSAESLLARVIRRHAEGRLRSIAEELKRLTPSNSFSLELVDAVSYDTSLALHLYMRPFVTRIVLSINPVTGLFVVETEDASAGLELQNRLNSGQQADMIRLLQTRLCRMLLRELQQLTALAGFKQRDLPAGAVAKSAFVPEPVVSCHFQRCDPGSPAGDSVAQIALTATVDLLHGLRWHMSHISKSQDRIGVSATTPLPYKMPAAISIGDVLALERQMLRREGRRRLLAELRTAGLRSYHPPPVDSDSSDPRTNIGVHLRSLSSADGYSGDAGADGMVLLEYAVLSYRSCAADSKTWRLEYTLRTALHRRVSHETIKCIRRAYEDEPSVRIDMNRSVTFDLDAALGIPLLPTFRRKLSEIARLTSWITTMRSNHFRITELHPRSLTMCYAPSLLCTLETAIDSTTVFPRFHTVASSATPRDPRELNPHARIQLHLSRMLCAALPAPRPDPETSRFSTLCSLLSFTLPLLRQIALLEARTPLGSCTATFHSATEVKLTYRSPLAHVRFLIAARHRHGSFSWLCKVVEARGLREHERASLLELLRGRGEGWRGLRSAVMADASGVAAWLDRVDTVVRVLQAGANTSGAESTTMAAPIGAGVAEFCRESAVQAPATAPRAVMKGPGTVGAGEGTKQSTDGRAGSGGGGGGVAATVKSAEVVVLD